MREQRAHMARLVVLAGLPGVGKSTLAREVVRRANFMWLRIDTMDQAIWSSGSAPEDLQDWTYRAAQAVAADNLLLGRDVLADCVNDWQEARAGWENAAARGNAELVWIEVACGDPAEHRHRVETRVSDVPGLKPPDWAAVVARRYDQWRTDPIRIDTAGRTVEASALEVLSALHTGSVGA